MNVDELGKIIESFGDDYDALEKEIEQMGGKSFMLHWQEHHEGNETTCPLTDVMSYLSSNGFNVHFFLQFAKWDASIWVVFPQIKGHYDL